MVRSLIKRLVILALAAAAVLFSTVLRAPEPADESEAVQPRFLTIPAPSLADNLLDEPSEQPIGVYLPHDYYDSDKSYPVLYFLTGFEGNYEVGAQFMCNAMNQNRGSVNEMIIVSIKGQNRFGGGFYANSPVSGNWQDYITSDVVSFIDEIFRTIPEASARGLAGHSMGGLGVINIVLNTSGVFGSAYAMSPAICEDGMFDEVFDFETINWLSQYFSDMDDVDAREAYLSDSGYFLAYAAAFGYNASNNPPYFDVPAKDEHGKFLHDETWDRYFSGMSNWCEKVENGMSNLSGLQAFALDYGKSDPITYIPYGCRYFNELLKESGINHILTSFDGDHTSQLEQNLKNTVIPFFSEVFGD